MEILDKNIQKLHRYPGAKPFEKEDAQIFFGRDRDIELLRKLVSVERMVVLYGKSGLGKSSLLNAGVLPLLTEYEIIPIRLQAKAEGIAAPLVTALAKIEQQNTQNQDFITQKFGQTAPIWAKLKSLQNAKKTKCICLVFDQFEELFTHEKNDILPFKKALAEAFFENIPQKVREIWEDNLSNFTEEENELLLKPLEIKIIFGIRDDRMSFLNELKDVFPNILAKTYKLAPLTRAQAEEAILNPAYKKEAFFKVPSFDYEDDALDDILNTLSNQAQEIESPQLQIICRHAESLVENKKVVAAENGRIVIQRGDLGELDKIYRDYYLNMLTEITNETERQNVQTVIEEELIYEPDERRIPCFEKIILDNGVSAATLRWLVNEHHILRSEPNAGGGFTYELSHDVLVKPILEVKKVRVAAKEKLRLEKEKAAAEAALAKEQAQKAELEEALRLARIRTRYAQILAVVAFMVMAIAVFFFLDSRKKTKIAEAQTKKAREAQVSDSIAKAKAEVSAKLAREAQKSDSIARVKADSLTKVAESERNNAINSEKLAIYNLCKVYQARYETMKEKITAYRAIGNEEAAQQQEKVVQAYYQQYKQYLKQ